MHIKKESRQKCKKEKKITEIKFEKRCTKCLGLFGRGIRHKCNFNNAINAIENEVNKFSRKEEDHFVARLLKIKCLKMIIKK